MKKIIILLLFSLNVYCQYTDEKVGRIAIDVNRLDTIKKTGYVPIYAFFHNELTQNEADELNKIIGENETKYSYSFELNFKFTTDGRIQFVTGGIGARKRDIPEELRGLPQYEKTYYDKQEFIDFINHYFERKRFIFKLVNRDNKNEVLDFSKYKDYTFYNTFRFRTIKNYPKVIDNKPIKR